jgi:hypothetical protein
MKKYTLWSLIALNVALAAVFVFRMIPDTTARAQAAAGGDYLMIPGEVIGGTNAVVWVLDQTNHKLSVMSYDDSSNTLAKMTPRDINRDFDAKPARHGNR